MSRLTTTAYEIGPQTFGLGATTDLEFAAPQGSGALETSVKRSGAGSWKMTSNAAAMCYAVFNQLPVGAAYTLGRTYYFRTYYCFKDLPSALVPIMGIWANGNANSIAAIQMNTDGTLFLWNVVSGTQIGNAVGPVKADSSTWYCIEMAVNVGTGSVDTLEFRLDSNSIASQTGLALNESPISSWGTGYLGATATTGQILYLDDGACNDDQGSSNNSWCGSGKVVVLLPVSDNSRTGFTAGAGGTTNLFDALDNKPPVGVADGSATNTSQIRSPNNNATDNYVANLTSYSTAGIGSIDLIKSIQGIAAIGNSSTTSRNLGLSVSSNPVGSEQTLGTGTTAAGTWDTGWTGILLAAVDTPGGITIGTQPTMTVRKATASTDVAEVSFMALLVEYVENYAVSWFGAAG